MSPKRNFQILVTCPDSGQQVLSESAIHFSVQGRKGVWWSCPSCRGWHVVVYEDLKTSDELQTPVMNPLSLSAA